MFARSGVLSLALSCLLSQAVALDLDINSQDSIKSTAKTLAGGIAKFYKDSLNGNATDNVPGVFPDPYYWWEAGAVMNTLIEYSTLTGDKQYNDLVTQALKWQLGDFDAFMPANQTKTLGNEDQSTWGLAAMSAAEAGWANPGNATWAGYAMNVVNSQHERSIQSATVDDACKGGLRWQIFSFNNGYNYMDSRTNSNFFLLAARLAKYNGNSTLVKYAEDSYEWASKAGLISKDFAVFDGFSTTSNCSEVNKIQWTSTLATYTEGAALMSNITTGDQQKKWADISQKLANATSVFTANNSALTEVACENNGKCDIDQKAFKGIAARSLARALAAAPKQLDSTLSKVIEANAAGAAKACAPKSDDVSCMMSWTNGRADEEVTASAGGLGQVFSALNAVQGLLFKNAALSKAGGAAGSANGTKTGSAGAPEKTGNSAASVQASLVMAGGVALAAALSL